MGLFKKYVSQTRKPEGFLGKMMIRGMNSGHAKMADWGLSHLDGAGVTGDAPRAVEAAIDIGCGGGRNAGELLKRYPIARVTAVDYSQLSVEKAKEFNRTAIEEGRCKVQQADVSALPFDDESFDLATAFETIYFWPGLENCFAEVARVLKPGGIFLIVNESDGTDTTSKKFEEIIDGMKTYTAQQITAALKGAGFSSVRTYNEGSKPWLTAVAIK